MWEHGGQSGMSTFLASEAGDGGADDGCSAQSICLAGGESEWALLWMFLAW